MRTSFFWIAGALVPAALPSACSSDPAGNGGPADDASTLDTIMPLADTGEPRDDATIEGGSPGDAGPIRDGAPLDVAATFDGGGTTGCALGAGGESLELRCTGLYADWNARVVAGEVKPYDPGLHLWSDGAIKTRWIYLPPAQPDAGGHATADGAAARAPIDTTDMNEWTFPVGTKFWKEFDVDGKKIETRLLWKRSDGSWYRTTYRWSDDASSTIELTDGQPDANGKGYEVPAQSACYECHQGRKDDILGFEAVALSSNGATPITLATLAADGLITNAPDAAITIPGNATAIAALGYLHANCGTACHNGGSGLARGTGFHMRLDVGKLATVKSTDTYTTGVGQPTNSFAIPGVAMTERLAPGDPDSSCVYYRMNVRNDVAQMPPIDSHKVDDAGVAVIGSWIAQGCQ